MLIVYGAKMVADDLLTCGLRDAPRSQSKRGAATSASRHDYEPFQLFSILLRTGSPCSRSQPMTEASSWLIARRTDSRAFILDSSNEDTALAVTFSVNRSA